MAITDQTSIENYMLTDIDSSFSSQIDEWIQAANDYMDNYTDRQLIADASPTDYFYNGTGRRGIMIDDFVAITYVGIKSDSTTTFTDITASCYNYPANKIPKWKVESTRVFPRGHQNVKITGTRGYTTLANLPKELKFVATVIVAGIINFSYQQAGEIASETIGRYTVSYNTDAQKRDYDMAMKILDGYVRVR